MSTIVSSERVVRYAVQGIRQPNVVPGLPAVCGSCAAILDPEILAPGIGRLQPNAGSGPHADLRLHRMVVVAAQIGVVRNVVELWIGDNEILRKCVAAEHASRLTDDRGVGAARAV